MQASYRITRARARDLRLLPAIELSAVELFVGYVPDSIPHEATSDHTFREAQSHGLLWVALADDAPVGFAHVELLEPDVAHLEELDVHPDHGRRGLGRQLVMAACEWAATSGFEAVTLTTFRDVPWNMPFYAGIGFEEIPMRALSTALVALVQREARRGLDPLLRVVMRRRSAPRSRALSVTALAIASKE